MVRVSEGKYRIGDTKVLIFVRVSTAFNFLFKWTLIFINLKRVLVSNGTGMTIKIFLLILEILLVVYRRNFN